ncbi:MAG: hypothetical protein IKB10_00040 [Alphaproteobacteria bacterium]|nr:hypothetical protein [Alphaproteobacteria bacterium]
MKKTVLLSAVSGLTFIGAASAADITLYYSPRCPHCHHARDFIANTLVYEYPELKVKAVNITDQGNHEEFLEVVEKCELPSGGVPVMVIGDKCEQGYADFTQDDIRALVEADLTEEQLAVVAANKEALAADAEKFKAEHADRANAIVEYSVNAIAQKPAKKNGGGFSSVLLWGLLVAFVAGLGYVLVRKDKGNK